MGLSLIDMHQTLQNMFKIQGSLLMFVSDITFDHTGISAYNKANKFFPFLSEFCLIIFTSMC
jgi:hypothetical protein